MGKRKNLNNEIRQLILINKNKGKSNRHIARDLGCSEKAVRDTIKRVQATGSVEDRPRTGRPSKTSLRERRMIVRNSLKNRQMTSTQLAAQHNLTGQTLSKRTVQRILNKYGLFGRIARKKPFINAKNRVKRLKWAKKHRNWTVADWSRILWSDEKKFNRLGSDGRIYVRRRTGEAFRPVCLKGTVKGGGGSLMCWASFSARGTGPIHRINGIMDQVKYKNILNDVLLPFADDNLPITWIFQHDNDPKHTAKSVTKFLQDEHIKVLTWPAQSPDLNPIENLWNEVDSVVKSSCPRTLDALEIILKNAWKNISVSKCQKLVASMPSRCQAVIKSKGYPTRY